MQNTIQKKIDQLKKRFSELEELVANPALHKDPRAAAETLREHARVSAVLQHHHTVVTLQAQLNDARELAESEEDADMREMASGEAESLATRLESAALELKLSLVPPDPLDVKNTIIEIRAGTGGDEAGLFAADLYRMYLRYAERMSWRIEIMDAHETEIGGFKEIIFSVSGKEVYSHLKYESGVHRVQRVPATESGGRIHTSAVTIAVLPEAEETDIIVRPDELRIDVFRSSGPGGQSVNTTDSAVRVTHIPTGLVVICQDEKSQLKNKAKALRVLKARLFEAEERRRNEEEAAQRRSQVGTGDRSERIRTYNFPQNRLTDHRINLTLYRLEYILQGDLTEVIDALRISATEQVLRSVEL